MTSSTVHFTPPKSMALSEVSPRLAYILTPTFRLSAPGRFIVAAHSSFCRASAPGQPQVGSLLAAAVCERYRLDGHSPGRAHYTGMRQRGLAGFAGNIAARLELPRDHCLTRSARSALGEPPTVSHARASRPQPPCERSGRPRPPALLLTSAAADGLHAASHIIPHICGLLSIFSSMHAACSLAIFSASISTHAFSRFHRATRFLRPYLSRRPDDEQISQRRAAMPQYSMILPSGHSFMSTMPLGSRFQYRCRCSAIAPFFNRRALVIEHHYSPRFLRHFQLTSYTAEV